ncbi:unnamed protein product [Orchesella dallaii]|uniref:Uncharacterized protein n=1 Tax=Orchesella dallaii TaxID=48710 RepID=A0ABP1QN20_9HEXA
MSTTSPFVKSEDALLKSCRLLRISNDIKQMRELNCPDIPDDTGYGPFKTIPLTVREFPAEEHSNYNKIAQRKPTGKRAIVVVEPRTSPEAISSKSIVCMVVMLVLRRISHAMTVPP